MHLLTELSYEVKRAREAKQIEKTYYCEINIYVTATPKENAKGLPSAGTGTHTKLKRAARQLSDAFSKPYFSADQLYMNMLYPSVSSKNQIQHMRKNPKASNR